MARARTAKKAIKLPEIKALKYYAGDDPIGAEEATRAIYEDMAAEAGVSLKRMFQAFDRVLTDGHYGPVSDREYAEQQGVRITMREAKRIVDAARQAPIQKIEYLDMRYPVEVDREGYELPNVEIDSRQIKRDVFAWYHQIYG